MTFSSQYRDRFCIAHTKRLGPLQMRIRCKQKGRLPVETESSEVDAGI